LPSGGNWKEPEVTHAAILAASGKYSPVENAQDALVFIIGFVAIIVALYILVKIRRGR
jgi:hypothetical protein